jgi:hypothetical protein
MVQDQSTQAAVHFGGWGEMLGIQLSARTRPAA